MRCLKVKKNGERLCLAGLDGDGVITAMVMHSTSDDDGSISDERSELHVHGSDSDTKSMLRWAKVGLELGDRVLISLVESDVFDAAEQRRVKLNDPRRGLTGSLVSLREEEDGSVSIVLDDVSRSSTDSGQWNQTCFVTHQQVSKDSLTQHTFSDDELKDFGALILARLTAGLN